MTESWRAFRGIHRYRRCRGAEHIRLVRGEVMLIMHTNAAVMLRLLLALSCVFRPRPAADLRGGGYGAIPAGWRLVDTRQRR